MTGSGVRRVGPAALAASAALVAGCGGQAEQTAPAAGHASAPAPRDPTANYRTLSAARTRTLLAYAQRLNACLRARGIEMAEPQPSPTMIRLRVRAQSKVMPRDAIACGDRIGVPPAGSSLQTKPAGLVLFVPRQCLLDPKVVATHGGKPA